MGATNFDETHFGKNVKEAYADAVDDARFEYGFDPYNGTISTTNGVYLFPKEVHPRYGTKKFNDWVDDILDEKIKSPVEKRGRAGAVEIPRSYIRKHYPHLKGKRGKMFYFFGWAAT